MKTRILSVILISHLATAAYAVNEGFYVGAQVGQTNVHNPTLSVQVAPNTFVPTAPDNKGIGASLLGGYNFSPYLACEGGYTYFGGSQYNPNYPNPPKPTISENALHLGVKGNLPIWVTGLGVFVKGGLAILDVRRSSDLVGVQSNSTSLRPMAAAGVSYDVTQFFVVDVSYSNIFGGGGVKSASMAAIGLSYHFVDQTCGQFLC